MPALKKALTLSIICMIPCAILVWLPSSASAEGKTPTITKASMVDANNDGKADEVVLTYSTKVNHTLQTSGTFPFSVEGYVVTKVLAASASKKLVIDLKERAVSDLTVTPFVTYTLPRKDPVVSTSGINAPDQTFIGTTAVSPSSAIYVTTSGSDSNPGTATSPKATIQAAIATAVGLSPISGCVRCFWHIFGAVRFDLGERSEPGRWVHGRDVDTLPRHGHDDPRRTSSGIGKWDKRCHLATADVLRRIGRNRRSECLRAQGDQFERGAPMGDDFGCERESWRPRDSR